MLRSPPSPRWAGTLLYADLNLVHLSIIFFYNTFSYIHSHIFIYSFSYIHTFILSFFPFQSSLNRHGWAALNLFILLIDHLM